jgi:hypothetical protein
MPYPIKYTPIQINLIALDTFPLWLMMVLLASRRPGCPDGAAAAALRHPFARIDELRPATAGDV